MYANALRAFLSTVTDAPITEAFAAMFFRVPYAHPAGTRCEGEAVLGAFRSLIADGSLSLVGYQRGHEVYSVV